MMESLLKIKADPGTYDYTDNGGSNKFSYSCTRPLLMRAYLEENFAVVDLLLKHGADINAFEHDQDEEVGESLLTLAYQKNNLPVMQDLLQCGADPNTSDKDGNALLSLVRQNNNVEMVQLLLKHGANIDIFDTDANQTRY